MITVDVLLCLCRALDSLSEQLIDELSLYYKDKVRTLLLHYFSFFFSFLSALVANKGYYYCRHHCHEIHKKGETFICTRTFPNVNHHSNCNIVLNC